MGIPLPSPVLVRDLRRLDNHTHAPGLHGEVFLDPLNDFAIVSHHQQLINIMSVILPDLAGRIGPEIATEAVLHATRPRRSQWSIAATTRFIALERRAGKAAGRHLDGLPAPALRPTARPARSGRVERTRAPIAAFLDGDLIALQINVRHDLLLLFGHNLEVMQTTNAIRLLPLLIYDGDCGFCIYWARYWQRLTGHRVTYAPYQEVAIQYPEIPLAAFQRAVQYIAPDGKIASGAEASFLTLSHASGKGFWLTLYRHLPGFAAISEGMYAFVASHRSAFYGPSLWLWGHDYEPPRFDLVSWLFLRTIGLIYLAAFVSFGVQALGLIGSHGILPLPEFAGAIRSQLGWERYWRFPMVFWLDQSDFAILSTCWAGTALSLLLIFNVLPRLSLCFLYALYLSLFQAGQIFMGFQWDALLLESGFLALFLSIPTKPGIGLVRWLLFRLMFLSGSVKLLSGDPTWANLSALSYHFQTQPLPTPLAWYAHHLPQRVLTASTAATFVIELGLPFLIFCPRRLRFVAAFGILLLEVLILLTGNYTFFNLLTMALCLVLFDDAALRKVLPRRLTRFVQHHVRDIKPGKIVSFAAEALALLIVFASLVRMHAVFGGRISAPTRWINNEIMPLHIVNTYGLFAVMTTTRPEIIIEGSDDGVHWREYAFKYKPGDVRQRPQWNIPHQPRLDWQMWFAALGTPSQNPWLSRFLERLLENTPEVTALLGSNPFAFPHRPPLFVRALLYDYRYSSREEKAATGAWWVRQPEGIYYPATALGS